MMASSTNEDDAISTTQLTQQVEDLSINNNTDMATICANCGKEGTNLNICNKCKTATYCNAACKKKHRSKHKQECEKRVAELQEEQLERERRAAELRDEKLFKPPPPKKDCDICMLPLPSLCTGRKYSACCGKIICSGCIYAVAKRDGGVGLCPFCGIPAPTTDEEMMEQINKRVELGDAEAIHSLGSCYSEGLYGMPQDYTMALELWHRSAKLGYATSYFNIGNSYLNGDGVERDKKKAFHYWELAAMRGVSDARHNLGVLEKRAGNIDRAVKHCMIAAGSGNICSLEGIKQIYKNGNAMKDDYAKALRVYQATLIEIKSPQRDEAAAFDDRFKYY